MKLTYRPEIDGLRAIAVCSVIIYHAQITVLDYKFFKGGFIGVDIFFVISGYLITSIILKELFITGSFSFKHFYQRRIRRIIPALLVVMLAFMPLAWIYLLPSSFVDFSKSILYSLGFSSNLYFWKSGLVYGAESGLLKPFLHTWSLSVEEQFYILFPIIVLITFRFFRKYLIYILLIGFLTSLALADWTSRNYPSFNFYILPTRGWELLAGSILAYFEITKGHRSKNRMLSIILPTIGLILIGHSILFFDGRTFHPSFYTLSPIIGVCLIIWFSHKDQLITKILTTKLFVGIGLISYSLYLWHYPIFAFSRLIGFMNGSLFNLFLIGIITTILSILSYYFVERPFRNKNIKFKLIINLILVFIFLLIFLNYYVIEKKGIGNRMPKIILNSLTTAWGIQQTFETNADNNLKSKITDCGQGKTCRFNSSSNKIVHLIGDSHMKSLSNDLKDKVINKNFQFVTNIYGGCIYFKGFNLVNFKNNQTTGCNDRYFRKIENQISQYTKNQILVFGGYFPHYLEDIWKKADGLDIVDTFIKIGKYNSLEDSFKSEMLKFSEKNQIILVYPIPDVGQNPNQVILNQWIKKGSTENFNPEYFTTSYKSYLNRTKSSFELLDSIKGENIYRVYPHKLFCDIIIKDRCLTHDNEKIFYFDDNHPSLKGSQMINELIVKEIEKIEIKSK